MKGKGKVLWWVGFAAVVAVGVCMMSSGVHAQDCATAADGTDCDDNNDLTRGDSCFEGSCSGICTAVTYMGDCVDSCPSPLVVDGSSCSQVRTECGQSCLTCDSTGGGCARCTADKFLEGDVCVSECSVRGSDGTSSYATTQNPYSRVCNSVDPPEEEPLSDTVIIGIAAGGGALLLIIIIVVCYIVCDKRCSKLDEDEFTQTFNGHGVKFASVPQSSTDDYELESMGNMRQHTTQAPSSIVPATPKDKMAWQKTVRNLSSTRMFEGAAFEVSAQTEHYIDQIEMVTLDNTEAGHIYKHIDAMKGDRVLYALLLKDMQTRSEAKRATGASADKYDKIIADLTVILRLFEQNKKVREFPIDCMSMLNWARATLDQYVNARATRIGGTETATDL